MKTLSHDRNIAYPTILKTMINEAEKGITGLGKEWLTLITAIVTFLTGLVGKNAFAGLKKWLNEKRSKEMFENLAEIQQSYAIPEEIRMKTEATRMLIFKGSDSGGIPVPGKPYWVSCLNGSDIHLTGKELHDRYHALIVDACYIEMLLTMKAQGVVKLKVDKMPECLLKDIYRKEGVKYSELYFLANDSKTIYFCSVASHDVTEFNSDSRGAISTAVGQLRGIFTKHYN